MAHGQDGIDEQRVEMFAMLLNGKAKEVFTMQKEDTLTLLEKTLGEVKAVMNFGDLKSTLLATIETLDSGAMVLGDEDLLGLAVGSLKRRAKDLRIATVLLGLTYGDIKLVHTAAIPINQLLS